MILDNKGIGTNVSNAFLYDVHISRDLKTMYLIPAVLLMLILPTTTFAEFESVGLQSETGEEKEEEEIVYFSLDENPEIVKERVSDAFWENPMNTPPMLVLIALAGVGIIVAWKRKWHIHEPTSDMRK